MPDYNVIVAIVQGFPESLALVFLVYALIGLKIRPIRILVLGLLSISLIYAVRSLGAPFPAHTLFDLVMMPVVFSMWEHIPLKTAALAWFSALMVLLVLEITSISLCITGGVPPGVIFTNTLWWTLVGLPHVFIMAVLGWLIYRRGGLHPFKETTV